ncbi:MAG: nitrate reductase subunit beta [Mycobacterium leprae]
MKIKAQVAMVMNLDKCIGCHTCSVTCKNTWTNRSGAEYMWFNNVETKPGVGYPRAWEDQEKYRGGWKLSRSGKLTLKAGSPVEKFLTLFHNPDLPEIDEYYEPWTYDYAKLLNSPPVEHQPVARPYSLLTGEPMDAPQWGPNWEDDLAGAPEHAHGDANLKGLEEQIAFEYEQAFMFYLPRICEHCLNPACVAACPSGAMYKREEDGIVLVDQEACRGWRFCVSACPYKKVYFNWQTHKAEKCTFCYPRIEAGLPTICSETCVGRIRYLGVIFYDADQLKAAASVTDEKALLAAQKACFLNPYDPAVIAAAREAGINDAWIEAAQNSPVYKMAIDWGIALPLHPEYRTLPMVWYVPPLSPIYTRAEAHGDAVTAAELLPAIEQMRIPMEYLANLLTAGDVDVIRTVLRRLAAMRATMRARNLGLEQDPALLQAAGISQGTVDEMVRLLSVAKYNERFVVPTARREGEPDLQAMQGGCSLDGIAPAEGPQAMIPLSQLEVGEK